MFAFVRHSPWQEFASCLDVHQPPRAVIIGPRAALSVDKNSPPHHPGLSTCSLFGGIVDGCPIADYALYPYTRAAGSVGLEITEHPGIESWLARVETEVRFIALGSDGAVETISFAEYFRP